ncbi:MAG: ABC transporter permease [Azoarcus sp.]|jgi:sulfonate transport system permease protein|nr:ABC transporter permease [Azoarcus sp.]
MTTTIRNIWRSRHFRGMALPIVLLVLWWQATARQWVSPLILVPFGQLFDAARDSTVATILVEGLVSTFSRLLQGCAIGIAAGLLLGFGMGMSRVFDRIMGPSFHALRQVAILAWIPLMTAWFGTGDLCKIIFVAIAASKPVVMGTFEGIRSTPAQLLEVGRVLGFSRLKMLRFVVLPSAAPAIVTALQLALIYSWFAAIGAEYVIGVMSGGIGSVVMGAQEHFRTDIVLLGVTLIATTGIVMNKTLRQIPRYLFRWRGRQ